MSPSNSRFGKRLVALALGFVLACPPLSVFAAEQPADYHGHWAETHIQAWLDKGYLQGGPKGDIRPDETVTRVEFMKLVNRSFGFEDNTSASASAAPADVAPGDPEYETVSTALAAGYITGYEDGTMRPSAPLTRQQAAVIVARLLKISDDGSEPLERFRDSADIAGWSRNAVSSVVTRELMVGFSDSTFRPENVLTRAETIAILDRALQQRYAAVYDAAGTYGPGNGTQTLKGDVRIEAGGVTLRNMHIVGSLTIGERVGEGDAVLDNVTVSGDVHVNGGGINSIYFKESVIVKIVINKKTGDVRIVAEGNTKVNQVDVQSPSRIDNSKATGSGFSNVTLDSKLPAGSKVSLLGNFDQVNVDANSVSLDVPSGSINNLNVQSNAGSTNLNLGNQAKVNSLVLNSMLKVTGQGRIEKAIMEKGAEGTTFEKAPESMEGEAASNPAPETATDPATNPSTDPTTDPPTDPTTDPPTDPPSDPPTDPTTDPPADPPTDPPTDPEPTVTDLVYSDIVYLYFGESLQLTLKAEMSDKTVVDVTDEATGWTSTSESVATVSPTGRVTAVTAGMASVTAQYAGRTATYHLIITESPIYFVRTAEQNNVVNNSVELTKDDDGTYILTTASDEHDWLLVVFNDKILPTGATASGLPGATIEGLYSGNDWMLVIEYEPVQPGSQYELIITGLQKAGSSPEPMDTVHLRFKR